MILQIRNMLSDCCLAMVQNAMNKHGIQYLSVALGEVDVKGEISNEKMHLIDISLREAGLELIYNKKSYLIEKIKRAICKLIYLLSDLPKQKFSDYISKKVNSNYSYLSNLFSEGQGITIEKYFISKKIERVKHLLEYSNLSLNEIAFKLHYSSVAHLSNQFKEVAGVTPSNFRQLHVSMISNSENSDLLSTVNPILCI